MGAVGGAQVVPALLNVSAGVSGGSTVGSAHVDLRRRRVSERSADVVVVGSGSAGAVVARRLVDSGAVRVLLLEAGGRDENPAIHDPSRVHELWLSDVDWAYETVPQVHAAGRSIAWPRGRVLGGSSCLHAMI